ncbi:recombinase family protein [Vibrio vulnificus]|nr:recombinase family protein [Vibrio vulnificus]
MKHPAIYIYRRVSTSKQTLKSGLDIQVKIETVEKLQRDYNIHEVIDLGSFVGSASKGVHLEEGTPLKMFIEQCKRGEIAEGSILAVYSLDRLSRLVNLGDARVEVYNAITNNGVRIYSEAESFLFLPHDLTSGILSDVIFSRAANESLVKSSRSIDGLNKAITRYLEDGVYSGALGKPPHWIDGKTAQFNEYAKDWQAIIKRYVSGEESLSKISEDYTIPYTTLISNIVRQQPETLLGCKIVKGVRLENIYPPLLTPEEYDNLKVYVSRTKRVRHRRDGFYTWILKGLVVCPKCGNTSGCFKNKDVFRIRCNSAVNQSRHPETKEILCKEGHYNLFPIEALALILTEDYIHHTLSSESTLELQTTIDKIRNRLQIQQAELEEAVKLLETDFSIPLAKAIPKLEKAVEASQIELQEVLNLVDTTYLSDFNSLVNVDVLTDRTHPNREKILNILQKVVKEIHVKRVTYDKAKLEKWDKYTRHNYSLIHMQIRFVDGGVRTFKCSLDKSLHLTMMIENDSVREMPVIHNRLFRRLREWGVLPSLVINKNKLKIK